uniref:SSD domain-containing protein n=1 Tax=Panagrolaimus sp. PS1159 TaxID=55785 RepID=A0AC35FHP9_9BILA
MGLRAVALRKNVLKWAPLEKPWANICGKYSILSTGILGHFEIVRGVHFLYAPIDAEWKIEENILRENWAKSDSRFYPGKDFLLRKGLYLIVEAADGGSVLRPSEAKEFIFLLDWIKNSTFISKDDEIPYKYSDICLKFQNACFSNLQARFIAEIFAKNDQKSFNITYPKFSSEFSTEPIDISKTIGGVELNENKTLIAAKNWMILYQLKQETKLIEDLSTDFELQITESIDDEKIPLKNLKVYYYHSETFDIELAEGNLKIIPRFTITFVILIFFSVLCTFNITWTRISLKSKPVPIIDWVVSKPLLGIAGVVMTLMAIVSAIGLLLLMNVTFVDMCSVMPFLSLTIGIDDTFLMLAAWHETSRKLSVEERVEAAMRHAGVSISITSLTDALAFLIGAIAPLPAVIYFCYYSCAAICFIFLYSMTIFVAFLSISGQWEEQGRHALAFWHETALIQNAESESKLICFLNLGSRPNIDLHNSSTDLDQHHSTEEGLQKTDTRLWYQRFFADKYAPFICHPATQIIALASFVAYLAITYTGIQQMVVGFDQMVVGFDLINIVRPESPSRRFLELQTQYFLHDVSKLDVAVLNPPNMGNSLQRNQFLSVLTEIETTQCSAGRNTTDFWYFSYQKYMDSLGFGGFWDGMSEDDESFNENLKTFLMANEKYDYDILQHSNGTLKAFRFTTQLSNYGNDEGILKCAKSIRKICNKYRADFNMWSYTPLWNLADQFEIMWPQTLQDLYISVIVMVPIALLMIPQPFCAFAIAGIDFSAHCTYAYMTEANSHFQHEPTPYERLVAALAAVGWPITQGSFSVFLGICTLITVQTYIVQTCFKTVLLVVIFGTVHALLYLPLILMHSHSFYLFICKKKSIK